MAPRSSGRAGTGPSGWAGRAPVGPAGRGPFGGVGGGGRGGGGSAPKDGCLSCGVIVLIGVAGWLTLTAYAITLVIS